MEIYFRKLELIHECIKRLSEIKKENPTIERYRSSWKDKDSAERNLHKIIEAVIDIGKMIIAGKKLREPRNNREVFIILPLIVSFLSLNSIFSSRDSILRMYPSV